MTKLSPTALTLVSALLLAAPVLAQTKTDTMKTDTIKSDTTKMPMEKMSGSMKGAPSFHFSTAAGMNMMMSGGKVDVTAAPGERLISRRISGRSAVLVYAGKNTAGLFKYYDSAIKSEGWKTTMMDGRMMSGGKMTGAAMPGKMGMNSATFAMSGHHIDLNVQQGAGRVTVTLKSR